MAITRRRFIHDGVVSSWVLLPRVSCDELESAITPESQSPDIFYDQDGLIVHKGLDAGHRDGGDTAQREGWYWLGVWIRQNALRDPWPESRKLTFPQVIRLLEPKNDGVFYRHPKLPPWNNPYDKEWGFSRDQMIPLVAAMGVWGLTTELRRLWNALPQDVVGGTKHTFNGQWQTLFGHKTIYTGDDVKLATINLFRRAWNEDPMLASDGNGSPGEDDLAANVGIRLAATLNNRDNTGDDLNLIVMLLMSILRFPSATSTAAVNLYAKNRPVSYGSFVGAYYHQYGFQQDISVDLMKARMDQGIASGWKTDASRVYGAVRWYQRAETGANPKLAELYRPIVRAYLE
jgi:hypothetical protein